MATIKTIKEFGNGDATNLVTLNGDEPTSSFANVQPQGVNFHRHQIAIDAGDNSSGTITVLCKANGGSGNEAVFEDGSALVINLATSGEPLTRTDIKGSLESFSFTFASLGGSDDVTLTVTSWNV